MRDEELCSTAGSSSIPKWLRGEALRAARKSVWLSRQAPEFQDALLKNSSIRRFFRNETIIGFEDGVVDLHFLLHGSVEVAVARPQLDLATIHIVPRHMWFGEHGAVSSLPSFAEYRARANCTALTIPHAAVAALQVRSAAFSLALTDLVALSLRTQFDMAASVVHPSAEHRIRAKLFTMAGLVSPAASGGEVTVPVSQEELAVISCSSRSTAGRVLRELAKRQVIRLGYGEITVQRPELLVC